MDRNGPFRIADDIKPLSPLVGFQIAKRWTFYAGPRNAYCYALCRPNGLPFYVGSGKNERALAHIAEALRTPKDKRTPKHDEILYLREHNEDVWFAFLGLFATRDEATVMENFWIQFLGFRSTGGILTNSSGPKRVNCDFPLNHIDHPEEPPTKHHPNFPGKWKHSVRVFHHSDYIVPPPKGAAIVMGSVHSCPACGELGQSVRPMTQHKLLCGNCAHYFHHDNVDDGSKRVFFGHDKAYAYCVASNKGERVSTPPRTTIAFCDAVDLSTGDSPIGNVSKSPPPPSSVDPAQGLDNP